LDYPFDTVWAFNLTKSRFGAGAAWEIGYEAKALGAKRVLVVTDQGVAKAGLVDKVVDPLKAEKIKVEVWDRSEPEPSRESIEEAIKSVDGKRVDLYIGLGGGSSIDTAKIVNLVGSHGGKILDYVAPPTGGGKRVPGKCKPLIAVPTTAGTGSETSPSAVVSFNDIQLKAGISSNHLRPDLAVLDPLLTVTMPARITAHTGMDALTHAVECYTTRRFDEKPKPGTPADRPDYGGGTPLTDLLAGEAVRLVGLHLRKAVYQGRSLEARSGMLLASFIAGGAFTNAGVGGVHAAAYPVGGRYHTPHGLTNAVLLPAVMEYNLSSDYGRFADIAEMLGADIDGLSDAEAAEASAEEVLRLSRDVGIPGGLAELGVKKEAIPSLASDCMKVQRLLVGNPRPITEADMARIYERAMRY
jgi:alcohol dehydrogenase class IV